MRSRRLLILCDPWGRTLFILACIVFMTVVLGPELFGGGKTKDYALWFKVGQEVLNGQDIYNFVPLLDFLYLPFAAIMLAPLAVFGKTIMYALLGAINIGAWALTIECTGRLCSFAPAIRATIWLPSLLILPLIAVIFDLGQPNIGLLALILLGFVAISKDRSGLGGIAFAFAASLKVFPVVILPYLVVRREFKAVATMILAILFFSIAAPVIVRGPQKTAEDFTIWSSAMLTADADNLGQRPYKSWTYQNQSLLALVQRLARPIQSGKSSDELYVNIVNLGFNGANLLYGAIAAVIGIVFLLFLMKTDYRRQEVRACEIGILLNLAVIASPVAYDYYYVWWLFPVAVLIGFSTQGRDDLRRGALVSALSAAAAILLNYSSLKIFPALGCMIWGAAILNFSLAKRSLALSSHP